MSDNWIVLISDDPLVIPAEAKQSLALEHFIKIAPVADKIEIIVSNEVKFFDCGSNFERVICPSCKTELPVDWWEDRMDEDYQDDGFMLRPYVVPCCESTYTLHNLNYEWSQGFGKFAIEAMNPNLGKLRSAVISEFESILNIPLRVIYQHI